MLRKFNTNRSLKDNVQLGFLTAITAGAINITSLILFFSFTSNVTGYYAIFAFELVSGNIHKAFIVFSWILLFFLGSFTSNFVIINLNRINSYVAHSIPLLIEIVCICAVGIYGDNFFNNTLQEAEVLVGLLLLSMGLQNGLTASISNFQVKSTHLTGATTDLGILLSLATNRKEFKKPGIISKAKLLTAIFLGYIFGAIMAGFFFQYIQFKTFYIVAAILFGILLYDWNKIKKIQSAQKNREVNT